MNFALLSRDQFKSLVFERDQNLCVNCQAPAQDAHHIIERRLYSNGGYFLDNGASLCGTCHLLAEQTILSCQELRNKIGIIKFPIPDHFYRDQEYDKWGNIILPNGLRLPGELFNDISVQKILAPMLHLFTEHIKYPRTYHVPWSLGITKDDRIIPNMSSFENQKVVVTLKLDGENTSIYQNYVHARSINYESHPSRSKIKALQALLSADIPKGWRICGENVTAKHYIYYSNLEHFFYIFSIWNEKNHCLSWKETCEYAELFSLPTVPILYHGIYDEKIIKNLMQKKFNDNDMEGYVIRLDKDFSFREFKTSVAKCVRANHVNTENHHWMYSKIEFNKIL